MSTAGTRLITAEEFYQLPDDGIPRELVRGEIVVMNVPGFRHGNVCARIGAALGSYLERHDIGDFTCNDSGMVTERNPDSVRGPDVAYFSYQRLPKEYNPETYPNVAPEIVWEVMSPWDRWKDLLGKVHEYLQANVLVVCVIDPERQQFVTYYPDRPEERINLGDVWREPAILPEFELPLEKVFRRGT